MRNIIVFILLICIGLNSQAQKSFNLGLSLGKRLNQTIAGMNRVLGASAEYTVPLSASTHIRIMTGLEGTQPGIYIDSVRWAGRTDDFWVVPVRIGVQQFLYEDRFFIFAEPGIAIGFFPFFEGSKTKINLSYAFGGAYRVPLKKNKYIQTGLSFNRNHYNEQIRFSWVSLRVAYGINKL